MLVRTRSQMFQSINNSIWISTNITSRSQIVKTNQMFMKMVNIFPLVDHSSSNAIIIKIGEDWITFFVIRIRRHEIPRYRHVLIFFDVFCGCSFVVQRTTTPSLINRVRFAKCASCTSSLD
jgi:hypothetical protein